MNKRTRVFRLLKYGALLSFAVLLLISISIYLQKLVLRNRAEQLLADVRSIELRRTTFDEVKPIFRRWHNFGQFDGECNEERCSFGVTLEDFIVRQSYLGKWLWLPFRIYELFGGRPTLINAYIGVQNGIVWEKGFDVNLFVRSNEDRWGEESGYTLIGIAGSASRLDPRNAEYVYLNHPNYLVGKPDGCENCLMVKVLFTPFADSADVRRLMQFDLSCLTRRKECFTPSDLMPEAWSEYSGGIAKQQSESILPTCGAQVAEFHARDAEDAAIVDVVSTPTESQNGKPQSYFSTVRLVERLKRAKFWKLGDVREFAQFESKSALVEPAYHPRVRPGSRFIILFNKYPGAPSGQGDSWLADCGVIPYSADHLALVRRGMAQDYAAATAANTQTSR